MDPAPVSGTESEPPPSPPVSAAGNNSGGDGGGGSGSGGDGGGGGGGGGGSASASSSGSGSAGGTGDPTVSPQRKFIDDVKRNIKACRRHENGKVTRITPEFPYTGGWAHPPLASVKQGLGELLVRVV